MNIHTRIVGALFLVSVAMHAGAGVAAAQDTIVVGTTDQQSGSLCTLSDAIIAINMSQPAGACATGQGVDTIRVPAGVYDLATYAVDESGELTALPYVTRPIRIVGDGPGATIIRRAATAPAMRLFKFQAPFAIEGMTLAGGAANHSRGGGAILAETFNRNALMTATARNIVFEHNTAPQGGALADTGFWFGPFVEFTLDQVVFTGNSSTVGGGAIHLSPGSVVNVTGSRFEDNIAAAWGGAIYNHSGGQVTIADSQFLRNMSNQEGGAIHAASPVLTRVTFGANEARHGGALYSYGGRPVITGSTFTGNRAQRGGAVEVNAGSVAIDASTFTANTAFTSEGGALWLDDRARTSRITNSTFSANLSASFGAIALINGAVTIINSTIVFNANTPGGWSAGVSAGFTGSNEVFLSNSIVAGNTSDGVAIDLRVDAGSGGDRFVSLGHNLIGSNEYVADVFSPANGDVFGTLATPLAAGLLALADNGGPTPTHALAAGSAAYDAGSLASPGTDDACLTIDQRGIPRPGVNTTACDIGAFESEGLIVPGGTTATSVGASLNPSTLGEAVTFTATVTAEPGAVGTPAGTVTFTETTTNLVLGSSAIDAAGAAVITTSALPAGLLTIQADYTGDGVFTGSSGTVGQTVIAPPAPTTTTLIMSANPSLSGAPLTLTAAVATIAPGSVPAGAVAFALAPGNTELGVALLDASGVAALTLSTLPEGTLQIEATYVPAGLFIASAASVTLVVSPLPDAAIRNGVAESRLGFSGVGTLLAGAGRPSCSGTMVGQFAVLTAAQCVRNAALADVTFSLGDGRSAPAASITAHPRFDTADGINLAFDVAIVVLDRDAAGTWNDVTRAALADATPAFGVAGSAVGRGAARTSGQLLVNDHLAGEGPVGVPIADAFIEAVPADTANQMFCEPGRGGPLFDGDRIAGVASFRFVATCAEDGPGYYINVARLADWIGDTASGDGRPGLAVADISVVETDNGFTNATFAITLSAAAAEPVTVVWDTADGTATAGTDYRSVAGGTLTLAPGTTTAALTVSVSGERVFEADEWFAVNLRSPDNAILTDATAVITIVNNDPRPVASIGSVTVAEDDSFAEFVVSLSNPSSEQISVGYATNDHTATAPRDYLPASATLVFEPGATVARFRVGIVDDDLRETEREQFQVRLGQPTNAVVNNSVATGQIRDDDPLPIISVENVTITEPNSGYSNAVFAVTLSNPTTEPITVPFATRDRSADAGEDYTRTIGTLQFLPGDIAKTIAVPVLADTVAENIETFELSIGQSNNARWAGGRVIGTIFDRSRPRITAVSPLSGIAGTSVTVSGMNFTVGMEVTLNGTRLAVESGNSTHFVVRVPESARSGPITVTNTMGVSVSEASFSVLPQIAHISRRADAKGRALMIVYGSGLADATAVEINGVAAQTISVKAPTEISVTVPDTATTGPVVVRTAAGFAVSRDEFRIAARITSVAPGSGFVGTVVAITGTDFRHVTGVTFNGVPASYELVAGSKAIRAVVPAGARTGRIQISITDAVGSYVVASDAKFLVMRP